MRQFSRQNFWSLGTSLGSLGPGSQNGPPEIFSNVDFLLHWDPNEAPDKVSCPSLTKKLATLRERCALQYQLSVFRLPPWYLHPRLMHILI